MPVTIGVFVTPGSNPDNAEQRSVEYDTVRALVGQHPIATPQRGEVGKFLCKLASADEVAKLRRELIKR
jgi:hypothetical protein